MPHRLQCLQVTGISYEQAVSRQLWDLFEAPFNRSEPLEAMVEMAARGTPVIQQGALHILDRCWQLA